MSVMITDSCYLMNELQPEKTFEKFTDIYITKFSDKMDVLYV